MNYIESLLTSTLDPKAVDDLRRRMERLRVDRANRMRQAHARVMQLEEDLARVALLSRSLAELCLSKGLMNKRELAEQLVATDVVDGALDFGLDPALTLPGEEKLARDGVRSGKAAKTTSKPAGKKAGTARKRKSRGKPTATRAKARPRASR